MKRIASMFVVAGVLGVALLWTVSRAAGELADVYLKTGLVLRGDVTTTDDEVIVRNAAGEMRVPRADVTKVVPVAPETQPATKPAAEPGAASRAGNEPTAASRPGHEATTKPLTTATSEPAGPELAVAPALTETDIQRLKLMELRLDGPAEKVRVRFTKKGKQRDLPLEVLDIARRRPDYKAEWAETLERGQPFDKLQLIVKLTGTKYVDRITIENDPQSFDDFRRKIMPLIGRTCARSGCHAGRAARVFRFPAGSPGTEAYTYSSFVLLDEMETVRGPLLDRSNPDDSALLSYLLPIEGNIRGHPPVRHGTYNAVIRRRDDAQYDQVLHWINELASPHPSYGLDVHNPYAGRPGVAASQPAESQPAEPQEGVKAASQPAEEGAAGRTGGGHAAPGKDK